MQLILTYVIARNWNKTDDNTRSIVKNNNLIRNVSICCCCCIANCIMWALWINFPLFTLRWRVTRLCLFIPKNVCQFRFLLIINHSYFLRTTSCTKPPLSGSVSNILWDFNGYVKVPIRGYNSRVNAVEISWLY